jgi:lysophospholipase L1-like esterase
VRAPLRLSVLVGLLPALLLGPALGAQEAGPKYLAFGDSITEGFGDTDPTETGYPSRLQALLRQSGQPEARVANHGMGGERTSEGLSRIGSVLGSGGDFILIMEGTNDINAKISTATTLFNLQQMVARARSAGITPIWSPVIPLRPSAGTTADRDLAIAMRQRSLTDDIELVDAYAAFSYYPNAWPELYNQTLPRDPVGHPNGAGYDLLAQTFADVILGRDTTPPVLGSVVPEDGAEGVGAGQPIEVVVFDHGAGIDATTTAMFVNGEPVTAQHSGGASRSTYNYDPPAPWSGVVTVEMDLHDLAGNTQRVTAIRFTVEGASFFRGDIDRNGRVDGYDLVLLAFSFGAGAGNNRYRPEHDLDNDGFVGGSDLAILASNFGRGA